MGHVLSIEDVKGYAVGCDGTPLPEDVLKQISAWYENDFGLGEEAHPCNHMSSFAEGGSVRSQYVAPALGAVS